MLTPSISYWGSFGRVIFFESKGFLKPKPWAILHKGVQINKKTQNKKER